MQHEERRLIAVLGTQRNGYNIVSGGEGAAGRKNSPDQNAAHGERQRKRFTNSGERKRISLAQVDWIKRNPEDHKLAAQARNETLRSDENRRHAAVVQQACAARNPGAMLALGVSLRAMHAQRPGVAIAISRALGGRPFEVLIDGEVVAEYQTVEGCARALGVLAGNIRFCLHGKRTHTHGYQFRYSTECARAATHPAESSAGHLAGCADAVVSSCADRAGNVHYAAPLEVLESAG